MHRDTGLPGSATRAIALAALASGALTLGGCHPKKASIHFDSDNSVSFSSGHTSVPSSLNCPDHVDELSRTAQAGDGQSCGYSGPSGQTVEISLMPLGGQTPQVRLASLEQTLKAQLGPIDADGGVHVNADGDHDRANIDLPGFHLHANGSGAADIQMPGVSINANGDKAQISTGFGAHKAVVNANSGGAEVRAGSVDGSTADLTATLPGVDRADPARLMAAAHEVCAY